MATAIAESSARPSFVAAENDEEVFDIYDRNGTYLGQELRKVVHANGIWHRAVYCFVFNSQQQLLLQRRSSKKKIAPLQWDLSVAEHLQPGESFRQGAERGLLEELGITATLPSEPLNSMHQRSLVIPGLIEDNEFVQSFRLDGWDEPAAFNAEEVCEVKFVSLEVLKADIAANPETYTQWLRDEITSLDWFQGSAVTIPASLATA